MLVIKKSLGYERVYNKETKKFVTIKYGGDYKDAYGNRILEELGEHLKADQRKFEKLVIVNSILSQKAIALVVGKSRADLNHLNINGYLKNPNNHVYFFNTNGEFLVDFQGYINENPNQFSMDNLLSVEFAVAVGASALTFKRTLTLKDEDGKISQQECFYNYSYNKENEVEIIPVK